MKSSYDDIDDMPSFGVCKKCLLEFKTKEEMIMHNRECFMKKWRDRLASGNVLVRYKSKQFIGILAEAERLNEFGLDLHFAMVEKVTVYDAGRLVVSLLEGTELECEME